MSKDMNDVITALKKEQEKDAKKGCAAALAILIVLIGVSFIYAALIMWLWNAVWIVVAPMFLKIGFWQAYGLSWLTLLLFGKVNIKNPKD